jgi:hypothetical protein
MQVVQSASKGQDNPYTGGQLMRAPGQTVEQAEAQYNDFVSGEVQAAQEAQIKFWSANPDSKGLSNEALSHFAMALHAVVDSTSPCSRGFSILEYLESISMAETQPG